MEHEQRRDEMTNIVKKLDALSRVDDGQSIAHPASILARLLYNLEESEGSTVDEELLNEMKAISEADATASADGIAISFLLFVDGLVARQSTVLVPSFHSDASASSSDNLVAVYESQVDEVDRPSEKPEADGMDLSILNVVRRASAEAETAPIDLKMDPVAAPVVPIFPCLQAQSLSNLWRLIEGHYVCTNCPKVFDSQRAMLGHAKTCFKEKKMVLQPLKCVRKLDYNTRGLRTLDAKTCPYCEVVLSSCHMVEHHSRKEHNDERTEVYGCGDCGRWCVTVMALIKHWDKHGYCPNGRLVVRKPAEASAPKSRKKDEKKVLFACGVCGKGFVSRLGVKYHVTHVCYQAPILDIVKLTAEGIQFVTTPTQHGFTVAFASRPAVIPDLIPPGTANTPTSPARL